MWLYVYRILVSWTSILLAVDAALAASERYLGEYIQRFLKFRLAIPGRYKIWFAVLVVIVAQGKVYFDMQKTLEQASRDNDGLNAKINSLQSELGEARGPLRLTPMVNTLPSSVSKSDDYRMIIVTANQSVYPTRILISCDAEMDGAEFIGFHAGEQEIKASGKEVTALFARPGLSPTTPLAILVRGNPNRCDAKRAPSN